MIHTSSFWRRTSCPIRFCVLLAPALAAGVAAIWMTAHRDQGYVYRCVPAADFYQLAEGPWISNFSIEAPGRMSIGIEDPDEMHWVQQGGTGEVGPSSAGDTVVLLSPGISQVVLTGKVTGRTLTFRTQWVPGQSEPLISAGGLRVGQPPRYSMDDFVTPAEAHPADDVAEARRLIEPLKLADLASDLERVEALAGHLHQALYPHRGQPTARMRELNGFEQYREAVTGRSGVYCANHAEIFAFMANVAGIPTRLLDISGSLGDVNLGAHTFVEVYLAAERRWAYIDLQLSLAGVLDAGRNHLSAAQVLARIRNRGTESLVVRTIRDGQVEDEDWGVRSGSFETFLSTGARLVFLPASTERFALSERLKRLLFDPPGSICENGRPERTAWRLFATWFTVGWGVLCLWVPLRHLRGSCGCPWRS